MKKLVLPVLTLLFALGVLFLRLHLGALVALSDASFITGFLIVSVHLLFRLFYKGAFDPFLYLASRAFAPSGEYKSYYDFRHRERVRKKGAPAHLYVGVSLLTLGAALSVISLFW